MAYERDTECVCCSPGVTMEMNADATLSEVLDALSKKFGDAISAPSVSLYGGANLYMRGVLEEETKKNLPRRMTELMSGRSGVGGGGDDGGRGYGGGDGGDGTAAGVTRGTIIVNDKKLRGPLRVKLVLK